MVAQEGQAQSYGELLHQRRQDTQEYISLEELRPRAGPDSDQQLQSGSNHVYHHHHHHQQQQQRHQQTYYSLAPVQE